MSVEATFVLIKCDGCSSQIGLSTDDAWDIFEATWFDGLTCQFCPDCKNKSYALERQAADAAFMAKFDSLEDLPAFDQV